jgi:hypothetical protein
MNLVSGYLANEAFFDELKNRKGLIPISIDVDNQKIVWLDMEAYHFYEGFFHKSLDTYFSLKKFDVISFTTDLNILEDDRVLTDYIYPTGFIFHAGRCGSTLLAKTLARSRENLVISEASPLNQVLRVFTKNGEQTAAENDKSKHIYRNLLLAMSMRRVASHQYCFIKFTSYNIRFFNFIHSVFPDVPAIFLTRDAAKIVASFQKRAPGWLNDKNPNIFKTLSGSRETDAQMIVRDFLACAADQPVNVLKPIEYEMLKPENLSFILSCFNISPNETQVELMKSQFAFDSKVEFNKKPFKE